MVHEPWMRPRNSDRVGRAMSQARDRAQIAMKEAHTWHMVRCQLVHGTSSERTYTPPRKIRYILFWELITRKFSFQFHANIFLELFSGTDVTRSRLWFWKLHGKLSWNDFRGKSYFSYIKDCFLLSFRNNFRLECKRAPSQKTRGRQ